MECNERMHTIARKASGRDQTHPTPSSAKRTTTTSASSGENFVDVDDLPNSSAYRQQSNVNDLSAMGQEQQGPFEMQRRELQHSQRVSTCPPTQISFGIWLVYLEGSIGMTIWDSMPLSNIYGLAFEWMQTDFEFTGVIDDIRLCFHRWDGTDMILSVRGVVFDIPLNKDDILEVRINVDRRALLPRPPGGSNSVSSGDSESHSGYHRARHTEAGLPRQMEKEGDNVGSKSYDKIRQTFKCTKFNGNTREWKSWNKNLMRFLSI